MIKKILSTLFIFTASILFGQTFPLTIIDDSTTSSGITKITTTDLNNDNFKDIVISQGYNVSDISFYLNTGEGGFGTKTTIDAEALFAERVATGDFNNDGWNDIATITRQTGSVLWYQNTNGNFSDPIVIGTNIPFINDIEVADFDENGSIDMVVIGQHSIDLFRNDGNGIFIKEAILTTETSPSILECMYLEKADLDNDGDIDLIVAETLGPVAYINNGLGIFSPETLQDVMFTTSLVHPFDMDNDGDTDIFAQDATGQTKWFSNDGEGNFTFVINLFTIPLPVLRSLESIDVNNDGFKDIYYAYSNKAVYRLNDGNGNFGPESIIYQNTNLFIREVAIENLNTDNFPDYIWASMNQTIAYHQNTNTLGNTDLEKNNFIIFPNPAKDIVTINFNKLLDADLKIITINGQVLKQLKQQHLQQSITIGDLTNGLYLLQISNDKQTSITKIIKN